jgi:integrase
MELPRKRELTWQNGTGRRKGRWKKWYRGRAYYLPYGTSKSDTAGYKRALKAWTKIKAEIDAEEAQAPKPHQEDYERAIEEWSLVLQWSLEHDDEHYVVIAREKIKELKSRLGRKAPPAITDGDRLWSRFRWPEETGSLTGPPADYRSPPDVHTPGVEPVPASEIVEWPVKSRPEIVATAIWEDRIESQRVKAHTPEHAVAANVDAFLATKEKQVRAGELTAGRYAPLKLHLHDFRDWLGPATDVRAITGKVLTEYHAELMEAISRDGSESDSAFTRKKRLSADYARDRISAVKTFVRWLYETDVIAELFKILTNKRALTIGKRLAKPETFMISEIKTLLEAATDRTKLYLLLMLNTGMYQGDISNLRQSEVDWKAGRITRKRSKTKKHKGVPVVSYILWKETFTLLRQERAVEGERVLVNQHGGALKVEELDAEGKLRKIDNIATAFNRLRRTTKIRKPLKVFRKTSSTLVRSNKHYTGLADLFLGLAPSSVADRFYADAPQALLDEAVRWLGKQYGVE